MSFSGVQEFHLNGLCRVYCFSPEQYLGYSSEAGVQVDIEPKFSPIYTDAHGDQVPEDVQNMGATATISFELIKWDQTVFAALQTFAAGVGGAGPGGAGLFNRGASPNVETGITDNIIGAFLKQCGWTFPVILERGNFGGGVAVGCETNPDGPYRFTTCYLTPDSFNLGTKNTRHRLTFNCLPNISGILFQVGSAFT